MWAECCEETLLNNLLVLAGVGQPNTGALFRRVGGGGRDRGHCVFVVQNVGRDSSEPPFCCTSALFCRPVCATRSSFQAPIGAAGC